MIDWIISTDLALNAPETNKVGQLYILATKAFLYTLQATLEHKPIDIKSNRSDELE